MHPWGSQASLPITSLEVKVAPALQGTVVVMAGKKRPWKCAQQAWLCQDGLIPVVSHLAPSGLNCPGLLGLILLRELLLRVAPLWPGSLCGQTAGGEGEGCRRRGACMEMVLGRGLETAFFPSALRSVLDSKRELAMAL